MRGLRKIGLILFLGKSLFLSLIFLLMYEFSPPTLKPDMCGPPTIKK
jgi:hypothetical protein